MFGQPSSWSSRLDPRSREATAKDLGQTLSTNPMSALPLVQVLVARASDRRLTHFGSDFRPQSKNVSVLELLQLRRVFRLYIISYVRQHSSSGRVNFSSKLRA